MESREDVCPKLVVVVLDAVAELVVVFVLVDEDEVNADVVVVFAVVVVVVVVVDVVVETLLPQIGREPLEAKLMSLKLSTTEPPTDTSSLALLPELAMVKEAL